MTMQISLWPWSRVVVGWALACAAATAGEAASAPANAAGQSSRPPPVMVLVHGASGGGWQFKQVATRLEARGWKVHRPTLSGLGERHHTATADIGLGTHIEDIVNFILFEDLRDVVLLGHSYAGFVIAGASDRIPGRIRHLVHLDALLPRDGEGLMTTRRPDAFDPLKNVQAGFIVNRTINPQAPPPRLVPQPVRTFTETVSLRNPAAAALPGTVILTVASGRRPEDDTFYFSTERARARGWTVHVMEGTHYPMLLQPEATAALLAKVQ